MCQAYNSHGGIHCLKNKHGIYPLETCNLVNPRPLLSDRKDTIFPYFENEATSTQPISTSPTMKSIDQLTYPVKGYTVYTFWALRSLMQLLYLN